MVLAYATDLATGQARDFALRGCVVAMRLAERLGCDERQRRNVYHQALLRYAGCNADTDLLVAALGDELELRRGLALVNLGDSSELNAFFAAAIQRLHPGAPPEAVAQGVGEALRGSVAITRSHCEVAQRIGARLGLTDEMCGNLGQLYERWDGGGFPNGLRGEAVGLAVRIVALCQDVIVLAEAHGRPKALELVARRGEAAYGPGLCETFLSNAEALLHGLDADPDRAQLLALEPSPPALLDAESADEALLAIADMIDMRMPCTYGHSRAVATLAESAANRLGLPPAERRELRWAAALHDLGELSVPVAVWLKAGPLSERERDEARLHPYRAERALSVLGEHGRRIGALVSRHHERLDGSGYHRGMRGSDLSPGARLMAAAEAFQTAREPRPHRPAMTDASAASALRAEVRAGRLCPEATEAVLASAGQRSRRAAPVNVDGLTPRELEVLGVIATGLTAKEVAVKLDMAPKTVDNHIQNIYGKIGVSTRAAATLYAVERGLVGRESPST